MNQLSKCIVALNDVRCTIHADPRAMKALDEAIAELESLNVNEDSGRPNPTEAVLKALGTISDIVQCFDGIAELIQRLIP